MIPPVRRSPRHLRPRRRGTGSDMPVSETVSLILPDGREADNGFMQTRYLSEGSIVVEVLARAGSELPKFVRILPTTDDGRPLPQYAADVRLRVVEY